MLIYAPNLGMKGCIQNVGSADRTSLMFVMVPSPLFRSGQNLLHDLRVPGNQLHLKISRNRDQSGFELVVLHVVGVRRLRLTSDDRIH